MDNMTSDEGFTWKGKGGRVNDTSSPIDAIIGILSNQRRRALLEYLWDQPDSTGTVEEAANHTATEVSREKGTKPSHEEIQIDLQHHHIPKLADVGIIEYDVRSQTIRYNETEELERLYHSLPDPDEL